MWYGKTKPEWRPRIKIKKCSDCENDFEVQGGVQKYCKNCVEMRTQLRYEWFKERLTTPAKMKRVCA